MLNVCEIFKSIQGESTYSGLPCTFVRLAGCNLSCNYCDTTYARSNGIMMSVEEIENRVKKLGCGVVELTGGEPLIQEQTPELCEKLLGSNYTVLVETNGSCDISAIPSGCIRIMDIKCPGSGMAKFFLESNLLHLTPHDECKFVISSRDDFNWGLEFMLHHNLDKICKVIFSPCFNKVEAKELANWILDLNAPVRLGLQIHKYIWNDTERGV